VECIGHDLQNLGIVNTLAADRWDNFVLLFLKSRGRTGCLWCSSDDEMRAAPPPCAVRVSTAFAFHLMPSNLPTNSKGRPHHQAAGSLVEAQVRARPASAATPMRPCKCRAARAAGRCHRARTFRQHRRQTCHSRDRLPSRASAIRAKKASTSVSLDTSFFDDWTPLCRFGLKKGSKLARRGGHYRHGNFFCI